MFQSNRDIRWAVQCTQLIVDPPPGTWNAGYDESSIDLHLDSIQEARIWDIATFQRDQAGQGLRGPELHLGRFGYAEFSATYLIPPPAESPSMRKVVGSWSAYAAQRSL